MNEYEEVHGKPCPSNGSICLEIGEIKSVKHLNDKFPNNMLEENLYIQLKVNNRMYLST